jgi:hypothetical protein
MYVLLFWGELSVGRASETQVMEGPRTHIYSVHLFYNLTSLTSLPVRSKRHGGVV